MNQAVADAGTAAPILRRDLITVSVMLATIMQSLDTTIANVALPHMQGSLSSAADQITWVLTAYIVAAAIATPLTGWLVGRFGRKQLFLCSVGGFTIASALCGMATNLPQIVAFRLLQGVFGAALVPLSQSLLLDINPREKHGSAMAIWGAGIMIGPILGPALGGWLTEHWNWRWVFYINLPIGLLAFAGIALFVHDQRAPHRPGFDFFGFATLSLGIGALQMMLDRGEQLDWFEAREVWVEAGLTVLSLYLFCIHTATARTATFLSRDLLKDRNFVTGTVFAFFVGVILYSTLALLPPMLQHLFDYPVTTTGMVTAPRGLGLMAGMLVVGRLISRVDTRLILVAGLSLTALSLWQMTGFTLAMDKQPIIVSGLVQGLGLGCVFVPLSVTTFGTLSQKLRTEGTAIYALMRNIGGSIGISVVTTLLTRNTQIVHATLAEHVRPDNPLTTAMGLHLHGAGTAQLATLNAQITKQAAMVSYVDDFKVMVIMVLVIMPLLLLLRDPRKAGKNRAAG